MPRYRLTLEYDGTPYAGWQRQNNGRTVQTTLETAIALFCGEIVRTRAAGRTDAGVHATHQVVHADLTRVWRTDVVRDAINARLRSADEPITVLAAEIVDDAFDARLWAIERRYLYRILDRRSPPALDLGRVWHVRKRLDADAMHGAAQALIGTHDFTTFRASECQANSPLRTLDRLHVNRVGEEVHINAAARSFLHHQVRSMVGTLEKVGTGRWSARDVEQALAARDRNRCGPMAPPQGLYLVGVSYRGAGEARSAGGTAAVPLEK